MLEFIEYCLGAGNYPQHPEVIDAVKAVQLAVEAEVPVERLTEADQSTDNSPDASRLGYAHQRFVIQRSVEGSTRDVLIFSGNLDQLDSVAPRVVSADSAAEESLSKFLLQLCGLDGMRLRVAPTRHDSATHALSIRDVAPLWYLSNTRLDNKNLALENTPHKAIKLRQVVDLVFDVFDEHGAALSTQISELQKELAGERQGLNAVWRFIRDQGIPDNPISLNAAKAEADSRYRQALAGLERVNVVARERTAFAENVRREYLDKLQSARESASLVRERETLLRRLGPLRAQYSDDLKKLSMLMEARRLFDPLGVVKCPACSSDLSHVAVVDGHCTLCRSEVPHLVHYAISSPSEESASSGDDDLDVAKELNSMKRRLTELNGYVESIEREVIAARKETENLDAEAERLQMRFDELTREAITPLIAERDAATGAVGDADRARDQIRQQQRMLESVEERDRSVQALAARLSEARRRMAAAESSQRGKDALIANLTRRFSSILGSFGYPKLHDAEIDRNLIPWVRGVRYDRVGSAGAMTLIALAWELTIFELSFEEGGRHPGFLMIDSPQKNLAPDSGPASTELADEEEGSDASDADTPVVLGEAIVRRVYAHIQGWLESSGRGAQIILVDNVPPSSVESDVIARFGGPQGQPPHGLIDDASVQ
ncbi:MULTISPECIES: hypothetical protein [unclassified Streptomyces]|uniref:hypothetical protein n=1 Tax=unclassified Streptomyces TaxID=2593676 RepID=UPI001319C870|nr:MULTISPECIES: hypothetical protein [unclassified Streptomyces]MYX32253.1 hypothetical protein [Streptomyces sp. SID8377]